MSDVTTPPFSYGRLGVANDASIYWETSGNPSGKPALYLHGGPGSGLGSGRYRSLFDPRDYLIVGIDQRGCGRSTPLAVDRPLDLRHNTTDALIADIEAVRRHLGIKDWLVAGLSWGSTLALAYAQQHPDRVRALVLGAVTTTSRAEIDWITEGIGRLLPEAWDDFDRRSGRTDRERPVDAYARRLTHADWEDRRRAARSWMDWEAAHQSLEPTATQLGKHHHDRDAINFATLVTHYWSKDGFMSEGRTIIDRLDRISHVPAVLVCGRKDIGSPAITAWRLHRRWRASTLIVIEEEGHGGPVARDRMREAIAAFARS